MDETIDKQIFEELLMTGRISVGPEEEERLRRELNRQMSVIRQLESIPLDEAVRPVIHGNPFPEAIRCGLREDEWKLFDNASGIVEQAPLSGNGYFVSPDVEHQKIG